jgi:5-methylcytosine-specific restriction endonuclease McrA
MRSAKSSVFHNVIKHCKECGIILQLHNTRDIQRKNYCSHSCKGKVVGKNANMQLLWDKNNTPEVNVKKAHHKQNHPKWIVNREKVKGRARPEMVEWRNFIFSRDKFTCRHCNTIGGKLHAHHKAPYSLFPELKWQKDNGITLCEPCHKEIHKTSVELFGGLTKKIYQGERFAY